MGYYIAILLGYNFGKPYMIYTITRITNIPMNLEVGSLGYDQLSNPIHITV